MDLRDRGGADGHLVELREEALERRSERRLDGPLDLGEGRGRQVVLELRQVFGGLFADQVRPGRQRLAKLDRRRADRDQRRGIIGRRRNARAETGDARLACGQAAASSGSSSIPRKAPCRASVRPHFSQTPQMGDRRGQIFQPE